MLIENKRASQAPLHFNYIAAVIGIWDFLVINFTKKKVKFLIPIRACGMGENQQGYLIVFTDVFDQRSAIAWGSSIDWLWHIITLQASLNSLSLAINLVLL